VGLDEDAVKNKGGAIKKYPASGYWSKLFDAELLEDKRNNLSPVLYACNYELTYISDDSLLFKDPAYGAFDLEAWRHHKVFMHVDAAYGGADTTAVTVYGNKHVLGYCEKAHVKNLYPKIQQLYRDYRCSFVLTETNADKGFCAADLRNMGLSVTEYHEAENKQVKIQAFVFGAWRELIFDEKTNNEYMEQVLFYDGKTGRDDAPDFLEVCNRWEKKNGGVVPSRVRAKVRIGGGYL
jgi:hypothetical protein